MDMARTVRQGGQTILMLSDAEMSELNHAMSCFDLEPANFEDKTSAEMAAYNRVADAILPRRN